MWSWEEFTALGSETFTTDVHCVTKWSKLDTTRTGVSLDTLLADVTTEAQHVVAWCDGDYTTNVPLGSPRRPGMERPHLRGRAAGAGARRTRAPARASPLRNTGRVPDGSTLLLFAAASLALLAVPGPAVIYVVTRSLEQGRTAGIVSVLGVETGTFAYALAAAAGLTGLIAASEIGFTVVRYAGAAYLVYLGARKLLGRDEPQQASTGARSRLFARGVLVQLLNPKIAIFFLAFLPQFVDPSHGPVAAQILVLGTIFTALAVLSDGAYVLLAGAVGGWLRIGRRARRLARLSGGVYVGLGVSAALAGASQARLSHH